MRLDEHGRDLPSLNAMPTIVVYVSIDILGLCYELSLYEDRSPAVEQNVKIQGYMGARIRKVCLWSIWFESQNLCLRVHAGAGLLLSCFFVFVFF